MIDSPEKMIATIREIGILPFFRCPVDGWSIQDLTAKGCWFDEEGTDNGLGPWDWKVECVREGDIAYGKFLGGKAAFATPQWYGHLMNWRRSLPKFRPGADKSGKLSEAAVELIRTNGSAGSREIRLRCSEVSGSPVKKNTVDGILQFLQMGTWTVIGDIQRVYRGPNLTYNGWQTAFNTTPEALLDSGAATDKSMPAWARRFEEATGASPLRVDCSPEESRNHIIDHILSLYPGTDRRTLEKLI